MFLLKDLFSNFFEVLDTSASDRAEIALRCPRGGRGGVNSLRDLGQSPSGILGEQPIARFI